MGYVPLDRMANPETNEDGQATAPPYPTYADYPPTYSDNYTYNVEQASAPATTTSQPEVQPKPIYARVIVEQPAAQAMIYQNTGEWKQSFCCGSCSDCADCCMGLFCPCLYACFLAKDMGESSGTALCNCLCWPLCLCCLRTKARGKHGIEGGLCCDCLTTQCFPCCAMIQMKEQYRNWRST